MRLFAGTGKTLFLGFAAITMLAAAQSDQAQQPVGNIDISGDRSGLAAAVPVVAVDPHSSRRIAVAWRTIDPFAKPGQAGAAGNWLCHLSLSTDGGASFVDQELAWGLPKLSRCNAPFVAFDAKGAIYVGGTIAGAPQPPLPRPSSGEGEEAPIHADGAVAVMRSVDGGHTWSAAQTPIASGMLTEFAPTPGVPDAAKETPWDGARGVVDLSDNHLFVTGAFPAPIPGKLASERFYAGSTDGGRSYGKIHAFSTEGWPGRWDGDVAAAKGLFAFSYIGAGTPDAAAKCPCAIVGVSTDDGATAQRFLVATADQFNMDTLVHYPEIAADPARRGRFAVALINAQRSAAVAFVSVDAGKSWKSMAAPVPDGVTRASRPAIAFGPRGQLLLAWRGYHADGGYNIYASSLRGDAMTQPVRVSSQSSHLPETLEKTYANRGDFHTSLAVGSDAIHVSWADARSEKDLRVYYARLPFTIFEKSDR
jgi:hypothetical protein